MLLCSGVFIWNTWRRYYYTHNLLWTLKYIFNTVTGRAICEEGLCSCTQECSKVLSSLVPTLLCMCSLFLNSYHCHTACFESSLLSLVATVCVLGFHIQTTASATLPRCMFLMLFSPHDILLQSLKPNYKTMTEPCWFPVYFQYMYGV